MKHVIKIDQHRPFTDKAVQKLLRFIKPDYVVHELAYRDFSDFEKTLRYSLLPAAENCLSMTKEINA